jgi:hypothetical protein
MNTIRKKAAFKRKESSELGGAEVTKGDIHHRGTENTKESQRGLEDWVVLDAGRLEDWVFECIAAAGYHFCRIPGGRRSLGAVIAIR